MFFSIKYTVRHAISLLDAIPIARQKREWVRCLAGAPFSFEVIGPRDAR
jgi:hypothetical protein